jgi:TolB-like protein/tRNA A-37 threonylcarbamoyl transferase component Bud32
MTMEPGTRLGRYEILAAAGSGGMGEVYRARDSKLGRDVALKLLPDRLRDDRVYRERLEREARTISQLQHPNVCTLFDLDEADGVDFLVMEFLEGETLADRLREGPLPFVELSRIGREIANAVDAAHRGGVVHRDLKPGNVMLTPSGVKVLDFGLAKEAAEAFVDVETQAPTVQSPLTAEGSLVGTMPYMAPEQLEGKRSDARTDIWALGCVLYEMATGERPFRGETQASLISSIMAASPEPPSRKQKLAPEALDRLVARCLEKDPERRWQSARDVSLELEALDREVTSRTQAAEEASGPAAPTRQVRAPRGMAKRLVGVLVAAGVVVAAVLWWWPRDRADQPITDWEAYDGNSSVAIAAPFTNVGDDPVLESLVSGVWDELSNRLARRTPVDREAVAREAASGLCDAAYAVRARWVYAGSMRRSGDAVRVAAQLWDCPDARLIWRDDFDGSLADPLALQDEIASFILDRSTETRDASIYSGREGSLGWLTGQRTKEANEEVLRQLREALEKDPSSTGVRQGLVTTAMQAMLQGWPDDPAALAAEMRSLAREICELQPLDPGCQFSTFWAEVFAGDGQKMLAAARRSVDMIGDPGSRAAYGLALVLRGREEEAIGQLEEVFRRTPNDGWMVTFLAHYSLAHLASGDYEKAAEAARRGIDLNVNDPFNSRANCYQDLAVSLAYLGDQKGAEEALAAARELRPNLSVEVALLPFASATPELRELFAEGLRRAGLE